MDTILPTELIDLIYGYCSHDDLKNLRLVSRILRDAADPLVFDSCSIGLFTSHLEQLTALSKTPELAKHVKYLRFDGDILPKTLTYFSWQRRIDMRPAEARHDILWDHMPRHSFSSGELAAYFQNYLDMVEEQNAWNSDRDEEFVQAFSRLPNLRKVSCGLFGVATVENRLGRPPWKKVYRKILYKPTAFERFVDDRGDEDYTLPRDNVDAYIKHSRCFIRALQTRHQDPAASKITELGFANRYNTPLIEIDGSSLSMPVPQNLDTAPFIHLTDLDLNIGYDLFPRSLAEIEMDIQDFLQLKLSRNLQQLQYEVLSILTAAKNLSSLSLGFVEADDTFWYRPARWDYEDASVRAADFCNFSEVEFPNLTKLAIRGMVTTEDNFYNFIKRNGKNLRVVALQDILLIAGTWTSLYGKFRGCFDRLEMVYFEGWRDPTCSLEDSSFFESGCPSATQGQRPWEYNEEFGGYDYVSPQEQIMIDWIIGKPMDVQPELYDWTEGEYQEQYEDAYGDMELALHP